MTIFKRFYLSVCIGLFLTNYSLDLVANEALPGGKASVHNYGHNAFSMPSANMSITRRLDFNVGNSFFRNPWVIAPASTRARDGLGPIFNTNSCQSCHIKDGRGHTPEGTEDSAVSLLIRLSIPLSNENQRKTLLRDGIIPEPIYGGQLQDGGIPGVKAEGRITLHWEAVLQIFPNGESISLRKPLFEIKDLQYGQMSKNVMISARVAPPMIGLGLLEAIPEASLLAAEDIDDNNNDGISGKANRVWDVARNETSLGRFGWKAGQPSLMQQNAAAFNGDLGITSAIFPQDHCTEQQVSCLNAHNGGEFEVSQKILSFVEFYTRNLAVPARTNIADESLERGKKLFQQSGCANCHTPHHTTAKLINQPEQSEQKIWPYTDLLLHDMGKGLADNRSEFLANGQEWRTAPLWGLSHQKKVSGHTELLHDGRARNVLEAILWHDGEAKTAKEYVVNMQKGERADLVSFVESL